MSACSACADGGFDEGGGMGLVKEEEEEELSLSLPHHLFQLSMVVLVGRAVVRFR